MRIQISYQDVVIPGQAAYLAGTVYDVTPEVGALLINRGQAYEIVDENLRKNGKAKQTEEIKK